MSATFPTLKPFVAAFNTSWGTYDSQGVSGYGSGQSSYAMHSMPPGGGSGGQATRRHSSFARGSSHPNSALNSHTRSADRDGARTPTFPKNVTHIRSNGPFAPGQAGAKSPTFGQTTSAAIARHNSQGSDDSKQMIIHQTTTCEVHYEEDEERPRVHSSRGRPGEADSLELPPTTTSTQHLPRQP